MIKAKLPIFKRWKKYLHYWSLGESCIDYDGSWFHSYKILTFRTISSCILNIDLKYFTLKMNFEDSELKLWQKIHTSQHVFMQVRYFIFWGFTWNPQVFLLGMDICAWNYILYCRYKGKDDIDRYVFWIMLYNPPGKWPKFKSKFPE